MKGQLNQQELEERERYVALGQEAIDRLLLLANQLECDGRRKAAADAQAVLHSMLQIQALLVKRRDQFRSPRLDEPIFRLPPASRLLS